MPPLPIIRFPDPRLRQAARPVTAFDEGLRALAQDLAETMRAAPGIGITAPHCGIALRLVVLDLPDDALRVYVNPRVVEASPERIRHVEGSVSMPGVTDEVERPAAITLRYHDLDGREHVAEAQGLLAICLQHEIDQLDGIFWTERLTRLRRERVVKRYDKIRKSEA
ncbi:peptide deformylase [Bosea sp. Leaf344]|uniref:peptide deformylase n=1 Tax=Bosea sp. Leaf344 TaxID=1736346 RepID=UPI000701E24B|nr:peptide deformylase [Bosea sp. Leaf344]KQU51262.1 peptide deformylase [Bosea sp. Leaf344]